MTKYLFLLILSLSVSSVKSQNQIIDSETKLPVSYAQIKLANKSEGILSDFNGFFVLNSSFSKIDTIVISCIGYNKMTISVANILDSKVIELRPSTQNLSEIIVLAKKIKYQQKKLGITKKPRNTSFLNGAVTGIDGEEKAVWIANNYSVSGYLKTVNVFVSDLGYPDAHFRIHVYACNTFETKPDKELTKSNIIASASKGNEWINIDMSSEQIRIGENGCFISLEWFDSPKSKFHKDTVFYKGQTGDEEKRKDTIYSIIRTGNGAVIGSIPQKYRISKNKGWHKVDNDWKNRSTYMEPLIYTTKTLSDGSTFYRTPDNCYQSVLCINIDVSFPKSKIELTYENPKKRKLNKLEKVKKDMFNYPQNNIHELFSSLIKAFESDNIMYVLKYLCVYKEDQLDEVLPDITDIEGEIFISVEEKDRIVESLKEFQSKLNLATLIKVDYKHFELIIDEENFNLIVDKGLWKINPYSYKIYK